MKIQYSSWVPITGSPDINPAEHDYINNPIKTHVRKSPRQITAEKEIASLKKEVVVLKEFILQQLYVIRKPVEHLKNKHYQHNPGKSLANVFVKREIKEKKIKRSQNY